MTPADVTDAQMRQALLVAEAALDEGDYLGSVRAAVDAFARLIELRPDMLIEPPPHRASPPQLGRGGPPAAGGLVLGGPRPWPSDHGVSLVRQAGQPPVLSFAKQRFTLSEAATYFEYTLDMVLRAQRHSAPA
jgi:hypothetical protein